jgi:hypothetical protein
MAELVERDGLHVEPLVRRGVRARVPGIRVVEDGIELREVVRVPRYAENAWLRNIRPAKIVATVEILIARTAVKQ